jgi:hypothetical protein
MLTGGQTSFDIDVHLGDVVRFYFTNTANTRLFNVALPGTRMKLVGGDSGAYEQERFVDQVLLAPSEGAIIDVLFAPFVCQSGRVAEQQLDGGIANAGRVVRVGPHVLRPSSPHSGSIHAFLRAVRRAGFEGASLPVGIDEDGRERLVFIDGKVPVAPYPDWSQSDTALASIARLLRGLHDAARGFDPQGLTWDDSLVDPAGGTLVCHNDVCPENVVFRDGIAVALLDFEFAAPGRPIYDVAQLARLCVPFDDDFDQARLGWRPADRPARLRLVADAYGLDRDGRAELLTAVSDAIDRIEAAVRRSVDSGDPNSIALWNRTGGSERYGRRRRWWTDHHDQFAAALL